MAQNAMVWGASGGIGRAVVRQLTDNGWQVAALSRHTAGLNELTDWVIEADPADEFQVQQAALRTAQELGDVTLWIYAAGDILGQPVADLTAADWQRILNANLTGAFMATQASLPLLTENAHLLFIGAYHERLQLPGLAAYAAAKAGLEAYTTTLAKEQRKRRVTLLRPGAVDTPLWEKMAMRLPKQALSPDDVAAQILAAHANGHKGILNI